MCGKAQSGVHGVLLPTCSGSRFTLLPVLGLFPGPILAIHSMNEGGVRRIPKHWRWDISQQLYSAFRSAAELVLCDFGHIVSVSVP